MKGLKIEVSGRVQGVGFRYFTVQKAKENHISGSVKNVANGNVKIIAYGDDENMNSFLSAIRRGPSLSYVSDFRIEDIEAKKTPNNFRIEY
jgi:acylphosphatase